MCRDGTMCYSSPKETCSEYQVGDWHRFVEIYFFGSALALNLVHAPFLHYLQKRLDDFNFVQKRQQIRKKIQITPKLLSFMLGIMERKLVETLLDICAFVIPWRCSQTIIFWCSFTESNSCFVDLCPKFVRNKIKTVAKLNIFCK